MNRSFRRRTASEAAKRYGVSLDAITVFEDQGLLVLDHDGRERYLTPAGELRLQVILKGRRLGFSLRDIRLLLAAMQDPAER